MKNIEVRYDTYVRGFVECEVCSIYYTRNGRPLAMRNITIKKGDEDYKVLGDILDDCREEVRVFVLPRDAAKERMPGLQRLVDEHNEKVRGNKFDLH